MTTPPYNSDQVLLRVFETIKNCLRVCVVNTLADPIPVTITSGAVNTTPTIFNVSCPTPGTEYSQVLPASTRSFIMKSRNSAKVLFAYSPAATEYLTLNAGFSFQDNNFYSAQTIYFKCSITDTVEVVAYV